MVKRRRTHRKASTIPLRKDNGKGWFIFDWIVVILFVIVLLIGGISALIGGKSDIRSQNTIDIPDNAIILQLFNGSGENGIISMISDSLRSRGIDIRSEIKKSKNIYPYTLLLDRKGNNTRIDSLAEMLAIPKDRIILQRNNDIFDATLVIGRDYKMALSKLFSKK